MTNTTTRVWFERIFFFLVALSLLAPFWVFKDLLFPYITSKAYFFRIVIELAIPFYVVLLLWEKRYRPNLKNPLHICMLAFVAVSFVSGMAGVNPLRSFWGNIERMGGVFYLAHLALLYFYVVLLGTMDNRYIQKFLQWFVFTAVLSSIYGILVWLKIFTFMPDPSYPRISSTFGNPIFFASFLILPMFISLFFVWYEDAGWKKTLYSFYALLMLVGIVSSATRGATVGLGVGLFFGAVLYLFLAPSKKARLSIGLILGAIVVVFGTLFLKPQMLPEGTLVRRMFTLRDSNTEARLIQWKTAMKGFVERPILGVGPENYYVISNKFYNPELYKYDASWFDKPHNYIIEILVTSGILGLLAYVGILISGVWGLVRAFKAGALSAPEASLLFAGLVTYEVQNLFVFDTIAASIAFFVFLAFMGFSWYASAAPEKQKARPPYSLNFVYAAFGISCVAVAYVIVAANVSGLSLSKNINYGYAYGSVDPALALDYFRKAESSQLDFDPVQRGDKFSDFALGYVQSQPASSATVQTLKEALQNEIAVSERVSNDPTVWQRLANLYLVQASLGLTPLGTEADDAVDKSLELAPQRPELQMMKVRLKLARGDVQGAREILEQLIKTFPTNADARMQLALLYHYTQRDAEAIVLAEQALGRVAVNNYSQVSWIADYYRRNKQYDKALGLYERVAQYDKGSLELYWQLAQTYALAGRKDDARRLAEALLQADPAQKKEIEAFIKTLR